MNYLAHKSKKKELTEMQQAFLDKVVETGGDLKLAAELAGYKGNSSRVSASRMLRNPKVQQYMFEQIQHNLGMSAVKAQSRLLDLCSGAKSEYVQLEASKDILDRAGFKAPDKHQHMVKGDFSINIDLK